MKLLLVTSILLLMLLGASPAEGKLARKKRGKEKTAPPKKAPPPRLNTDGLPNITQILAELGLEHREDDLKKKGVGETRHLLRLEKMDYHMMIFDWGDDASSDVEKIKKKAEELLPQAIVKDDALPAKNDRHKLKHGRIYIPGFVKSLEYISASFGVQPPMGPLEIVLADPLDGCDPQPYAEGKMLFVSRGNCTFLQKSLSARTSKASLLVIINSEDKLESVTTGYGIDPKIKNKDIEPLHRYSVISTANTSLAPLQHALQISHEPIYGHAVPLKCGKLGKCAPVTEAETSYQRFETSCGRFRVFAEGGEYGPYFDFLTSNYGGLIPSEELPLVVSDEVGDACSPLSNSVAPQLAGSAVLVKRGNCPFDIKVINVQNAGGIVVVFEDPLDRSLQRIGGSHPLDGQAGIPSVAIPFQSSERIHAIKSQGKRILISFEVSQNSTIAEKWIEVSYTSLAEDKNDRLTQLEGMLKKYQSDSQDIVAWLKRRIADLGGSLVNEL